MRTPQIIMMIMMTMSVTISLVKHGEDKGTYNFWYALIGTILEFSILKYGGFFND